MKEQREAIAVFVTDLNAVSVGEEVILPQKPSAIPPGRVLVLEARVLEGKGMVQYISAVAESAKESPRGVTLQEVKKLQFPIVVGFGDGINVRPDYFSVASWGPREFVYVKRDVAEQVREEQARLLAARG